MPWLRLQAASCEARLDLTSMTSLSMSALSVTMSPAACNAAAIAQNNGWGMGACNTSTSFTHTVDRFIDYQTANRTSDTATLMSKGSDRLDLAINRN